MLGCTRLLDIQYNVLARPLVCQPRTYDQTAFVFITPAFELSYKVPLLLSASAVASPRAILLHPARTLEAFSSYLKYRPVCFRYYFLRAQRLYRNIALITQYWK